MKCLGETDMSSMMSLLPQLIENGNYKVGFLHFYGIILFFLVQILLELSCSFQFRSYAPDSSISCSFQFRSYWNYLILSSSDLTGTILFFLVQILLELSYSFQLRSYWNYLVNSSSDLTGTILFFLDQILLELSYSFQFRAENFRMVDIGINA